jgi:hypothetical protein
MDDLKKALSEFQSLQNDMLQSSTRINSTTYRRKTCRHSTAELRAKSTIPRPAHHFQPLRQVTTQEAREKRIKLHAYIANNQGLPAKSTPDELHFLIDTRASITITNSKDDFVSPIHPVQPTK